jgi:Tfp pilus assembly protein PilX
VKNERGYALLFTVLTIVFVSVIGIGLITITSNSNQTTVHERQDQSLYYTAEAGINITKAEIVNILNDKVSETIDYINTVDIKDRSQSLFITHFEGLLNDKFCLNGQCNAYSRYYNDFSLQNWKQPVANVVSNYRCENSITEGRICKILLNSKGSILGDGSSNREVEQEIIVYLNRLVDISTSKSTTPGQTSKLPSLADIIKNYAIFTSGNITMEDGTEIDGLAGSTLGLSGINIPSNFENRDAVVKDLSALYGIDLNQFLPSFPHEKVNKINNPDTFPDFTTIFQSLKVVNNFVVKSTEKLDLSKETYNYISNFDVDKDIKINVGNKNIYLVVDDLTVRTAKDIEIEGTGTLTLIVKNSFNLFNKINKKGNPNQLNIYYESDNKLIFDDVTAEIGGSLFVRNGNVEILKSLDINGDYYQGAGSLHMENPSNMNRNVYIKNVDMTVEGIADIYGDFLVENSNVTVSGGADVKGNMYVKSGNVLFTGHADVEKDFYMLDGTLKVSKLTDIEGNIFYAGENDLIMDGRSDAKKGKLIVAPNAKLLAKDSMDVYGTIIAKEVVGLKNADLKYRDPGVLDDYLNGSPLELIVSEFRPLNDFTSESPLIER